MPVWCPSFQLNEMAYLPTGVTSLGRMGSLYMGSAAAFFLGASPIAAPVFSRSSSHVAQGQASRRYWKEYALLWPSSQSISMPVPVVFSTRTAVGWVDDITGTLLFKLWHALQLL